MQGRYQVDDAPARPSAAGGISSPFAQDIIAAVARGGQIALLLR